VSVLLSLCARRAGWREAVIMTSWTRSSTSCAST
jgi:hypothetical protein